MINYNIHHVDCPLPLVIHPITLDVGDEQLIDTFDVVETPHSVVSLSSNDSLHQPPPQVNMGEHCWISQHLADMFSYTWMNRR